MNITDKVKLFTHNDLDGVGCAILAKMAFDNVEIQYCGYSNINEKVKECDFSNYDLILITDISVNEEVASILNGAYLDGIKIQLIDHHKTALWLNKYKWSTVIEKQNDTNECGTTLFFDYLTYGSFEEFEFQQNILNFSETVRMYDTWEWKEKNELFPKELNDLFHILGTDRFINRIVGHLGLYNSDFKFDELDKEILAIEKERIEKYITQKNNELDRIQYKGYNVGVVIAEQYISELGNKICERNSDIDFCIIVINFKTLSFRTIKDIDLSLIAKELGGGGHPKASGAQMTRNPLEYVLDFLHGN